VSRCKRVAQFCQKSGGLYIISLLGAGKHRPCDGVAIANWHLSETLKRPNCFGCGGYFSRETRPAAFLTATGVSRQAGVAVCALCPTCWNLPPEQIEAAALSVLRRHLNKSGRWL
jgi:hypothetical protein